MIHWFEPAVWQTLGWELLKLGVGATVFVLAVFGISYLVVTKKCKNREEV